MSVYDAAVGCAAVAVAYTALTLSPWRPQSAGLFVSGSVFFYCTYLTWGALTSQPAGTCVPASGSTLPIQVRVCDRRRDTFNDGS